MHVFKYRKTYHQYQAVKQNCLITSRMTFQNYVGKDSLTETLKEKRY